MMYVLSIQLILKKLVNRKLKKNTKKIFKNTKKIKVKDNKTSTDQVFLLKLIDFQNSLKFRFSFKINLNIEKYIKGFFDKIANIIDQYKILKKDETRRLILEKQEFERLEKISIANQKQKEQELKIKLQEQALKQEIKLEKQRNKDKKLFLKKEQA